MLGITRLSVSDPDFENCFAQLLSGNEILDQELTATVSNILNDVRDNGVTALVEYTNRFDRRAAGPGDLEVPQTVLEQAVATIPQDLRRALEDAAERITAYHRHQTGRSWSFEDQDGSTLGQRITPLDRVGIYVPGGKAAYPSTVLMNAIPARVAGVGEIVMTAPAPDNELDPVVLAAAHIAGVDRVFSVGGAQAVAALAFGAGPVPAVDKIVGPGNRYVAAAKRLVFGVVGIDMIAGPSEVVIVADDSADPDWIAMDMFAQAEHDEDARAILVTADASLPAGVEASVNRQISRMERAGIIRAAMENNGAMILVEDAQQACDIVNRLAPEHLELAVQDPGNYLEGIRHAGAIFLGHFAAEALGDYCAGPNHVLPTARTARFSSPLGVYDFQKRTSLVQCTPESASRLAETATILARAEGLTAHARAAELRMK
ncbi:MAG: histidinol dehydrogenase [Gammaproteobacteria bacterium]|nr:histidinol dehydrogenase [Gammaproteobacteria bacterium]MDE0510593.1 histidinol dehydrogenase [Gammaproteobacteria bacterium]